MSKRTIVAFGEIMLRLTAADALYHTDRFDAAYGGSESNVLVTLSCLGHPTRYLTKLPANDLGRGAVMHLQKYGVDCRHVLFGGDTMGMYFLEPGFDTRAAKVIYARKHAEVTTLCETDIDYADVLEDCAVLHISGISFALSPSVKTLCFTLLREAKKRNIPISFDFNYRAKLWSVEQARSVLAQVAEYADLIFCSQRDLDAFLGVTQEGFFDVYKGARVLVVRERAILSADQHAMQASVYTKDGRAADIDRTFCVKERIGGGDAFTAGFLHSWLNDSSDLAAALDTATACFTLKHTVDGDVLAITEAELNAYKATASKDVMR